MTHAQKLLSDLKDEVKHLEDKVSAVKVAVDDPPPFPIPHESLQKREMDYEHFRIRREMIVHEDHQINHRTITLVTTQSILFTAVTVALTSSYRTQYELQVRELTTILSVAGLLFGVVMFFAIGAARHEQKLIRAEKIDPKAKGDYGKALSCGKHLENCLQASSRRTFPTGHSYTQVLSLGSTSVWVLLLCLIRNKWP